MTNIVAARKVSEDFRAHKFREGESYDKFLFRRLKVYGLSLDDYYAGHAELVRQGYFEDYEQGECWKQQECFQLVLA